MIKHVTCENGLGLSHFLLQLGRNVCACEDQPHAHTLRGEAEVPDGDEGNARSIACRGEKRVP